MDDLQQLVEELEQAREHLRQMATASISMEDYKVARSTELSLERKVAAAKNEEYAETIEFPARWDTGSPCPHLLTNGQKTYLLFYLQERLLEKWQNEAIVQVQFMGCFNTRFGAPNEEVMHGHPLYGKGIDYYEAQIVHNSKWLAEIEAINRVHAQYNPDRWRRLNHYLFWFHDDTFECLANSFEVEIMTMSMQDALRQVVAWMYYGN